jgi:hypothetical protein
MHKDNDNLTALIESKTAEEWNATRLGDVMTFAREHDIDPGTFLVALGDKHSAA